MKKYIALIDGMEVYIIHAESKGEAWNKVFDHKKTDSLPYMEIREESEIEVVNYP